VIDPVATVARAAAGALVAEHGPGVPGEVEAVLGSGVSGPARDRYGDPVSIGALVVSIATLAWTVYTDLRKQTPTPAPEVVARTVRVKLRDPGGLDPATRDRVIEVVVGETHRVAATIDPD
jgi:hypothetical protein